MRCAVLTVICLFILACKPAEIVQAKPQEAPKSPGWTLVEAFPGLRFQAPVDLQHAKDGSRRLYVVQQSGVVKVFDPDKPQEGAKTFLKIKDRIISGGEQGLLGLAFHPDYKNNGRFFVNYTAPTPKLRTVIAEFTRNPGNPWEANPKGKEILSFDQPYSNHNGGQIAFGPDGKLYIAVGDGGAGGDPHAHGQNRSTLLGNVLRIDVDKADPGKNYGIPADNPFVGKDPSWRPEIWAWGLRNPWRISFDSKTGKLWTSDVGQNKYEEINILEAGKNYGWRLKEGEHCFKPQSGCQDGKDLVEPIHEYDHASGQSITGGTVYRGKALPGLQGAYLYADFASSRFWALRTDGKGNKVSNELLVVGQGIYPAAFGVDADKEVYVCDLKGKLWKFKAP